MCKCPVAVGSVPGETGRMADVARAGHAEGTWRELRMGTLGGALLHGPWGGAVFIQRLRKPRKSEQQEAL